MSIVLPPVIHKVNPLRAADTAARAYPLRSIAFKSFRAYHRANPHVYQILVDILREGKQRGFDTWSIQGAMEVARWERKFETVGLPEFKIANGFGAYYSRLVMMQED